MSIHNGRFLPLSSVVSLYSGHAYYILLCMLISLLYFMQTLFAGELGGRGVYYTSIPLPHPDTISPGVVKRLEDLCRIMLDNRKDDRYADISEYYDEADEIVFDLYKLTEEEKDCLRRNFRLL
jgi:hypothetical protein